MKCTITSLIFLYSAFTALAQTEPTHTLPIPTYRDLQDSLFQHLDKSRLVTGVLYDRAYHWANAASVVDGDTLNIAKTLQYWHELILSTYDTAGKISSRQADKHAHFAYTTTNVVQVGYLNYGFETFDDNALEDGRLVMDEKDSLLYDGNGESPFKIHTLVAPVIFSESVKEPVLTFRFDPLLTLSNRSAEDEVVSITLRNAFDESIVLLPGEEGSLQVWAEGQESATFVETTLTLASGLELSHWYWLGEFKASAYIAPGKDVCTSGLPSEIESGPSLTFQGIGEPFATQGKGNIKIFYRLEDEQGTNCNRKLEKPIIVLDGFDPQDKSQEGPDGVYTLFAYEKQSEHLGHELRLMGYDLVVLNFPVYADPIYPTIPPPLSSLIPQPLRDGGTDYMERNARVLIKLIQQVNDSLQNNGSSEKTVIIGPSMGGQISRYALKYMEDNSMDHNCRLWIAFDSPNLGANIPIGLQGFIWFAGTILGKDDA